MAGLFLGCAQARGRPPQCWWSGTDRTYRVYRTYQGWGGRGSANFSVDRDQTKLKQMSLKVLSRLSPVPLKEVLGWVGEHPWGEMGKLVGARGGGQAQG